jgi:carbon-monoxide dehydrogenase large subunit
LNFDTLRFGAGRPGDHDEQATLVQGRGAYTSDIELPGQLHACFVRSVHAHAHIRAIDTTNALALPGVHAVITGAQMQEAGIGRIPPVAIFNGSDGKPMYQAGMPPLAWGTVRYVGEALALVVADSAAIAADAAELVETDLEVLPVASSIEAALAPDAPAIWPDRVGNIALDWEDGDIVKSDAAFAAAFHVETVELDDPPMAASPLETRACNAQWDTATGSATLIASTQGVMIVRKLLAEAVFKLAPEKLRVITPDVGGGFGVKVQAYPEYAAVLFAAKVVGRPVKWSASRAEGFLGDTMGRNSKLKGEMAFDREGRILGVRADVLVGLGAYTSCYVGIVATNNTKNCLSSVYRIPSIRMRSRAVFTNTAPLGPYRGAGRPEAIYMLERLLDRASVKFRVDRSEMRRRNLIPASAMPYSAPNGQVYDSGEFEAVMNKALGLAAWQSFGARRAQSARAGKLRGIGMCCFLEVAGGILEEPADLRFSEDGTVSLHTGAQALGQGHLATFPRLVARHLGIDVSKVRLVAGDSDQVPGIVATVASRSIMMAGSASSLACDEAIRRGKAISAHLLETAETDIVFADGKFSVVGTDRSVHILDITPRLKDAGPLPEGVPSALSNLARFTSPTMSFPNGCHICEVEVDPETGVVRILRYTAVDDVGVILNQTIVEGQITGGVAQGLGQVFGEQLSYSADGQLRNASFMDYPMPHAGIIPPLVIGHLEVPCRNNPLGVKGAGESGVTGALPSTISAILQALETRGVKSLDMPFTPGRVWAALNGAPA